jgi:hypothetical protein
VSDTDDWVIRTVGGMRHVLPTRDRVTHSTAPGSPCICRPETHVPRAGLKVVLHASVSTIAGPVAGIAEDYE